MNLTARCGFDGPTALVRDGYWISKQNLSHDLPAFVKAAERAGLTVRYGSADLPLDKLPEDEAELDVLRCFAANGITAVRMQHVPKHPADDPRTYAERFRRQAAAAAEAGRRTGVRCVIQLHGGCYPHNATAAYEGVRGLDPKNVGIKIDPGNNRCQEGYELFSYQIALLREYVAALGAKDVGYFRPTPQPTVEKGWRPAWLPAYEGMIDYRPVFEALYAVGFDGPVVAMPFYEYPPQQMEQAVARELQYFQNCAKEAAPHA